MHYASLTMHAEGAAGKSMWRRLLCAQLPRQACAVLCPHLRSAYLSLWQVCAAGDLLDLLKLAVQIY